LNLLTIYEEDSKHLDLAYLFPSNDSSEVGAKKGGSWFFAATTTLTPAMAGGVEVIKVGQKIGDIGVIFKTVVENGVVMKAYVNMWVTNAAGRKATEVFVVEGAKTTAYYLSGSVLTAGAVIGAVIVIGGVTYYYRDDIKAFMGIGVPEKIGTGNDVGTGNDIGTATGTGIGDATGSPSLQPTSAPRISPPVSSSAPTAAPSNLQSQTNSQRVPSGASTLGPIDESSSSSQTPTVNPPSGSQKQGVPSRAPTGGPISGTSSKTQQGQENREPSSSNQGNPTGQPTSGPSSFNPAEEERAKAKAEANKAEAEQAANDMVEKIQKRADILDKEMQNAKSFSSFKEQTRQAAVGSPQMFNEQMEREQQQRDEAAKDAADQSISQAQRRATTNEAKGMRYTEQDEINREEQWDAQEKRNAEAKAAKSAFFAARDEFNKAASDLLNKGFNSQTQPMLGAPTPTPETIIETPFTKTVPNSTRGESTGYDSNKEKPSFTVPLQTESNSGLPTGPATIMGMNAAEIVTGITAGLSIINFGVRLWRIGHGDKRYAQQFFQ
ncbi:hypothetical protein EBR43_12530, partial [bacterium]|nr:hypothetical protein [bacterium]